VLPINGEGHGFDRHAASAARVISRTGRCNGGIATMLMHPLTMAQIVQTADVLHRRRGLCLPTRCSRGNIEDATLLRPPMRELGVMSAARPRHVEVLILM
jgi:hypothetical protein